MTTTDFTYLLNHPDAITEQQTLELERILSEFPYFQSARALRLKGLYNQNSFMYNLKLKKTAAATTDRAVLFDFITSDTFLGESKSQFKKNKIDLHDIVVFDTEVVSPKWTTTEEKRQQSVLSSIDAAQQKESLVSIETDEWLAARHTETEVKIVEEPHQELEIGKPLAFSQNDTHSFQEWLQLTKYKPIVREEALKEAVSQENTDEQVKIQDEKQRKIALIDKFIEVNPKIIADKNTPITPVVELQPIDNTSLMTETLAKVYLEQKKYQRAIDAYDILILKYPEKSVFFADRIENIKKLQQNNN
ncbi:MAG TPA: hypothetical protein VLZ11_01915 [Flavobacterium sp.]|nr:hypothetical protein [Flavobacterium sp.]